MRILHQFKLMTRNGFGIPLILVERIKIDIAPTWKGLPRTTIRIENERSKGMNHRGKNCEMNEEKIKEHREEL